MLYTESLHFSDVNEAFFMLFLPKKGKHPPEKATGGGRVVWDAPAKERGALQGKDFGHPAPYSLPEGALAIG